MNYPTIEWVGGLDGHIRLIDQTLLPGEYRLIDLHTVEAVWEAIKTLRVRGAPAIGVAGAMGVVVSLRNSTPLSSGEIAAQACRAADYLATSRPTAVNLFWALDRMKKTAQNHASLPPRELRQRLLDEAVAILREDDAMCHAMGRHGAALLNDGDGVLTHCNAGGLAT
ncbi:MAG TPA: S-methyl-5-thioribose-1-phosphate isomerase, partial [Candidatus Brocadiia bacterium]|nr:S-methyl-5-thioribose-1-phosphate isomerase [Candidatus Brocadiia bacterium]